MHIFLDSSVILSFCRSKTGASALVLDYCRKGKLKGYISEKVVFEVQKNTHEKMDEKAVERFQYVLNQDFLTIVADGTQEEVEKAIQTFNNPKDAPILASAKQTPNVKFILSLDDGFFKTDVLAYVKPIEIL